MHGLLTAFAKTYVPPPHIPALMDTPTSKHPSTGAPTPYGAWPPLQAAGGVAPAWTSLASTLLRPKHPSVRALMPHGVVTLPPPGTPPPLFGAPAGARPVSLPSPPGAKSSQPLPASSAASAAGAAGAAAAAAASSTYAPPADADDAAADAVVTAMAKTAAKAAAGGTAIKRRPAAAAGAPPPMKRPAAAVMRRPSGALGCSRCRYLVGGCGGPKGCRPYP